MNNGRDLGAAGLMTPSKVSRLLQSIFLMGFVPVIAVGDYYIYLYSVLGIVIFKLKIKSSISKQKGIIYLIGIFSCLVNIDISILFSLFLIFLYDELVEVNKTDLVKYSYFMLCLCYAIIFILFLDVSDFTTRINLLNNNVFNALLFIYVSIFALSPRFFYLSLPNVFFFISRTALIMWLIYAISSIFKVFKYKAVNYLALFVSVFVFFSLAYLEIEERDRYYHWGFNRLFVFDDNSLSSRLEQYTLFVKNLDFFQLLTNGSAAFEKVSNHIMIPHSSLASAIEKGGIFYMLFIYLICAYLVRPSIFLPIFFGSLVLHNAFLPHLLILFEKFRIAQGSR